MSGFSNIFSEFFKSLSFLRGGEFLEFSFRQKPLIRRFFESFGISPPVKAGVLRYSADSDAVFDYDFMMSLDEKDYKKYLCEAYYAKTGEKLNLKHPKNLNQKIQWLKIYDNIPIKSALTDKILVRDYVREKIGEEYLKPVLWIGDRVEDIPFESLPDSFIVKANHGCKWHYIVKNKKGFLANKQLVDYCNMRLGNWLKQNFFGYSDFETQYLNIKPKIIIEPLIRENINIPDKKLCVWCAGSEAHAGTGWHELNQTASGLSKILADSFRLVRVDWMIHNNKLYFEEMTFTPLSGYIPALWRSENFYKNINKAFSIKK